LIQRLRYYVWVEIIFHPGYPFLLRSCRFLCSSPRKWHCFVLTRPGVVYPPPFLSLRCSFISFPFIPIFQRHWYSCGFSHSNTLAMSCMAASHSFPSPRASNVVSSLYTLIHRFYHVFTFILSVGPTRTVTAVLSVVHHTFGNLKTQF